MSTTSYDSIWSVGATQIVVPVGVTLAVFCTPQQGQQAWQFKCLAGGSCEILPTGIGTSNLNYFFGTTTNGGTLVALSGKGYPLSISAPPETVALNGPASFYLSSLGVTSVVAALLFKGAGN